ncbi:metal ABC transporter permease [Saccharothrix yanglingensis]|uniref:metal ABC transporter permease n=1 Tax=Saccharothrix yanglingensis TaxID=659496 RepID=UPI0027D32AD5|nr:metal ABC transporter permease [Saccharothrix yanglingensis]
MLGTDPVLGGAVAGVITALLIAVFRAVGPPVFRLDVVLHAMVTLTIVISVQAVGDILVLALLVTLAAAARSC